MPTRRQKVIAPVVAMAIHILSACSSSDVATTCADIQKQCLASGKCLESSNRGTTSGEGRYGDEASGEVSDEATCDIRCVSCELVNDPSHGGSASQETGGASSTAGSSASGTGGAGPDAGGNGVTVPGGAGGACGLVSVAPECTSCLESQALCCTAAAECASDSACLWLWDCYQRCELAGADVACTLECRDAPQRGETFVWSPLHNCLMTRCGPACPAFDG
jgi:hypothetical protein